MGRSTLGPGWATVESPGMASDVAVLDLTDEHRLLAADHLERHPDGVRSLLAALNLKPAGRPVEHPGQVVDLAIYRATGDRRLATLFGSCR